VATSAWRVEGDEILGRLEIATCGRKRTSAIREVQTSQDPDTVTSGNAAVAVGVGLLITGSVAFAAASGDTCTQQGEDYRCHETNGDKVLPSILLISSAVSLALGYWWLHPESVEVNRTEEQPREPGPCLNATELASLELALEIGAEAYPVLLGPDGSARIRPPKLASLPHDYQLPIVVHRVPPSAQALLKPGHVIGIVVLTPPPERAPEEAEDPTKGTHF
jgi:hypothetical protein